MRLGDDGFTLLAAPVWAYRKKKHPNGYPFFEVIPEVWRSLLRQLQRRADEVHAQKVAEVQALTDGLTAGTLSETDKSRLSWLANLGVNPLTVPARTRVQALRWVQSDPCPCRWCRKLFMRRYGNDGFGNGGHYCSNDCAREGIRQARHYRVRPSRAKPPKSRTRKCVVCRARFTPKRGDARFCSGRCRIADFRRRGEEAS